MNKLITDKYPLVTVFTLIYNTNPQYIIEAIESVRTNNYPNVQHIIIDDCSPNPEPKEIVKNWIEKENYDCEFYVHDVNYGLPKTLNHVLKLAKGEFLIGCCDDVLLPGRIYNDIKYFLENNKIDLIHSKAELIDSESKTMGKIVPNSTEIGMADNLFQDLLISNYIVTPTVSLRISTVKKLGGYSDLFKIEDYEMWLRLSSLGSVFYFRDEVTTKYRIHNESFSLSNWRVMFVEDIKIKILYTDKLNFNSIHNIKKSLTEQVRFSLSNDDIMPCFDEFGKKFGHSIWLYAIKNKLFQFFFRSVNRFGIRLAYLKRINSNCSKVKLDKNLL